MSDKNTLLRALNKKRNAQALLDKARADKNDERNTPENQINADIAYQKAFNASLAADREYTKLIDEASK